MDNLRATSPQKLFDQKIGARIRRLRKRAGMSQGVLANHLHRMSPTSVHYLEKGIRSIKVFDLVQIAQIFCVSVNSLLADERPRHDWNTQTNLVIQEDG